MVVSNQNAMGIIFPNSFDTWVSEMVKIRLMASLPFASRYRLVDFVLSDMSNCGIDNIVILPKRNYFSLMDHLGSGREWDLVRKTGGLHIIPPFAESGSQPSSGRVGALANILGFLKEQKEKYVIMSDTNMAINIDFSAMLAAHMESGADITFAYNEQELPESFVNSDHVNKDLYFSFDVEDKRITNIYVNSVKPGIQNLSLNIFIINRELLIELVSTAFNLGQKYFTRDVIVPQVDKLNIQGYKYTGYVARIWNINSYFEESMKLLDEENLDALFDGAPIYTKIRDDNPTRYISGCVAKNVMVADGCIIEGEVENSVLFRGVKIGKGAKVKNCVLMQDTCVEAGADIEYLILDKDITVSANKVMKGTDSYPVYIAKGVTI